MLEDLQVVDATVLHLARHLMLPLEGHVSFKDSLDSKLDGYLKKVYTSSADLQNSIIEKQRKELKLLIAELKDRDKELNDTVSLHQRQLLAWENDRQKILTLQQKSDRLESELQRRNNIIKSLTKRIHLLEGQQQDRKTTLESTQQQLQELSLIATEANSYCQDLEDKNQHLNESTLELSAQVGRLQAREQELSTLLKLKDEDLIKATNHITKLTIRFKDLEAELHNVKLRETSVMRQAQDLPPRLKGLKLEVDKLKDDLRQKIVETNEQREDIIRLKQESTYLQAEMVFAAEREKRKDQLLLLAKSKQTRADTELQNLRQVYLKQHHDLQFLHLTLENAHDKAKAEMDMSGLLNLDSLASSESEDIHGSNQFLSGLTAPLMQSSLKDTGALSWQQDTCSPATKLQRLLVESRQLVAELEHSSLISNSYCGTSTMNRQECSCKGNSAERISTGNKQANAWNRTGPDTGHICNDQFVQGAKNEITVPSDI
ncbi:coiled-coil domain-containing protein 62 [Gastrophryne carolinensis]